MPQKNFIPDLMRDLEPHFWTPLLRLTLTSAVSLSRIALASHGQFLPLKTGMVLPDCILKDALVIKCISAI